MDNIDKLNVTANKLINLFDDCDISFNENNHFSYFVSCFYFKQRQHLISLLNLKNGYDLQLICRTMIEGTTLLYYAQNNEAYIAEWIEQADIENLKLLKDKEENEITIPQDQKESIQDKAKKLSRKLKNNREKDIRQTKRSFKYDDFRLNKITMGELIKSLSKEDNSWENVYYVYDLFSKWNHWNPISISQFINIENNQLKIIEKYSMEDTTKLYGIFCLNKTSIVFDDVFKLNKDDELTSILNETMARQKTIIE